METHLGSYEVNGRRRFVVKRKRRGRRGDMGVKLEASDASPTLRKHGPRIPQVRCVGDTFFRNTLAHVALCMRRFHSCELVLHIFVHSRLEQ